MSAVLLYAVTAALVLFLWHRWIRRMSVAACLVIALLPLCFTGRALLTGRIFAPVDLPYMSEPLHAHMRDFGVGEVHNGALSDVAFQVVPWRKAERWSLAHGEWPLWNPFISCGQVLAAAAQPAVYDPWNLLSMLIPLAPSLTFLAAIAYFLAALFAFAFLRELELSESSAVFGAASWMLCASLAFFIQWSHGRAWVYLPLILLAARRTVRRPGWSSGALLVTALTLLIVAGHPETLAHVVLVGVAYGAFELWQHRERLRLVLITAIASGIVALLLSAIYLMPLNVLWQTRWYDIRHELYAPTSFMTNHDVLVRRAMSSLVSFYGGQPARGILTPDYDPESPRCGSIALALAVLGFFRRPRRRETLFFACLAVIAFYAAIDAWPVAHFLHWLPVLDVALNQRLVFAASFALAVLAAIGLEGMTSSKRPAAVVVAVAIVITIAAAIVMQPQMSAGVPAWWISEVLAADLLPLVALAALLLFPAPRRWVIAATVGMLLVQRVIVDGSTYPAVPERAFYPRVPLLDAIRPSPEPFRVIGQNFAFLPNSSTLYELEDVRGYDVPWNRLATMESLYSTPQTVSFNVISDLGNPMLPFLNVRYAITPSTGIPPPGWRVIEEDRGAKLMECDRTLPRAFVPRTLRYERSDYVVRAAMSKASDFAEHAWIQTELPPQDVLNGTGTVVARRAGSGLNLDANMHGNGWVIVSEADWPGWRTYIDGRRVRTYHANYAFMAIYVPKGHHQVRMRYLPESFTRGRSITFSTAAVLLLFGLSRGWREARRGKRRTTLPGAGRRTPAPRTDAPRTARP